MVVPDNRKLERSWNQLLELISKGNAVPIVGEELLQLAGEPQGSTLYGALAKRYATEYGIELEEALQGNLSAVVRGNPSFFSKPFRIYQDVAAEFEAMNPEIPEPLRALARIRHFNLFVTTTFDDLLERALNEERFQGQPRTEVISFAPNNIPADQAVVDALGSGRPVVFQFFGNYKTAGQYAVTEADMVEYVHCLEASQKKRLITELYDRPVLLLGNSFPDWLTRILLRLVRNRPLDHGDLQPVYVADAQVTSDSRLQFFLRNFAANTEVVEQSSADFVGELCQRWSEKFGAAKTSVETATATKARPMPKNAVFISYCRSDAAGRPTADAQAAFAIRDGLEARGVEVWLDRDQLQGGDEYETKIKRYIDTSSLFIPLISDTTDARADGFFRKEWLWAIQRLAYFTGADRHFIVPVIIGPADWRPKKVPKEFSPMHYERLPEGQPDARFLDHLQALYQQLLAPN
jgi:hypothetical protein